MTPNVRKEPQNEQVHATRTTNEHEIPNEAIKAANACYQDFDYTPDGKTTICFNCQHTYPDGLQTSRHDAMKHALEAALPAILNQLAAEIRGLSQGDIANPEDCVRHEPEVCYRCYGREQAAQHLEGQSK